jgi:general stress protein 26
MNKMPRKIIDFILEQRACVLATSISNENVHASAMLYSCNKNPLELYFFTQKNTKKVGTLLNNKSCNASIVIGTTEELKQTLQLTGSIKLLENDDEISKVKNIHYKKFPQSKSFENQETLFLKFSPNWWRHTNYESRPSVITK